jgi:tRNA(fMet)-specific endonuclease VapC
MKAFDTDVLTEILAGQPEYVARAKQIPSGNQAVPIVVIEEMLRGRLNAIRRAESARDSVGIAKAYEMFERTIKSFRRLRTLPYTEDAEERFQEWRRARIRVSTRELQPFV